MKLGEHEVFGFCDLLVTQAYETQVVRVFVIIKPLNLLAQQCFCNVILDFELNAVRTAGLLL